MKTIRVSLDLGHLNPSEKVTLWGNIKTDMTGNSNFSSPNPTLSVVDAQVVILSDAIVSAKSGDHGKIAAMHAQEDIVDMLLEQLSNYVELTANSAALIGGDATAIITSAGMGVAAPYGKAPLPNSVTNIKGTSFVENEIELSWNGVEHARAYIIEISSNISASGNEASTTTTVRVYTDWDIVDVCHKPRIILANLISGTKYALRIISSGTAGKSAASSVVIVKVL